MPYTLVFSKTAKTEIGKLDSVAKKSLAKKLELYSTRPTFYAKKLVHSSIGEYRWRVGDYRIVFDLKKDEIVILRVGHRREVYK